jgi:hypothetical protein
VIGAITSAAIPAPTNFELDELNTGGGNYVDDDEVEYRLYSLGIVDGNYYVSQSFLTLTVEFQDGQYAVLIGTIPPGYTGLLVRQFNGQVGALSFGTIYEDYGDEWPTFDSDYLTDSIGFEKVATSLESTGRINMTPRGSDSPKINFRYSTPYGRRAVTLSSPSVNPGSGTTYSSYQLNLPPDTPVSNYILYVTNMSGSTYNLGWIPLGGLASSSGLPTLSAANAFSSFGNNTFNSTISHGSSRISGLAITQDAAGTPADGGSVSLNFRQRTSTTLRDSGYLSSGWSTVAEASRRGFIELATFGGSGTATLATMRLTHDGDATGFLQMSLNGSPISAVRAVLYAAASTYTPLVLSLAASQGAQAFQIRNSSGTTQLAIAANGRDFVLDTTTGTKIGTATNQRLSFFDATPVVRQTGGVATASGTYGATEQTMLQTAYNALRTYGLLG